MTEGTDSKLSSPKADIALVREPEEAKKPEDKNPEFITIDGKQINLNEYIAESKRR